MSQEDIYNLLKKTKKTYTSKELSHIFGIASDTINVNLNKLIKWGFIKVIKSRDESNRIIYLYKIK